MSVCNYNQPDRMMSVSSYDNYDTFQGDDYDYASNSYKQSYPDKEEYSDHKAQEDTYEPYKSTYPGEEEEYSVDVANYAFANQEPYNKPVANGTHNKENSYGAHYEEGSYNQDDKHQEEPYNQSSGYKDDQCGHYEDELYKKASADGQAGSHEEDHSFNNGTEYEEGTYNQSSGYKENTNDKAPECNQDSYNEEYYENGVQYESQDKYNSGDYQAKNGGENQENGEEGAYKQVEKRTRWKSKDFYYCDTVEETFWNNPAVLIDDGLMQDFIALQVLSTNDPRTYLNDDLLTKLKQILNEKNVHHVLPLLLKISSSTDESLIKTMFDKFFFDSVAAFLADNNEPIPTFPLILYELQKKGFAENLIQIDLSNLLSVIKRSLHTSTSFGKYYVIEFLNFLLNHEKVGAKTAKLAGKLGIQNVLFDPNESTSEEANTVIKIILSSLEEL